MAPSNRPNRRLDKIDWILIAVLAALLLVIVLPHLSVPSFTKEPIAGLYNPVSGEFVGVVIKEDPQHHFPDGTVREGWLIRAANGYESWTPADNLRRGERINR
jgi:hypothetical protein